MINTNQDAYYQEIEWKRHYHLIEYQRCVLAQYSLKRHKYVRDEEIRMRRAFYFTVIGFGLLAWYCYL